MRKLVTASLLALSLAMATAASAAPATWTIDPNHSEVGFSIRHMFSKVPGNFGKFQGAIVYDAQIPENSSVKVDIDASSINTRNEKRDNHLRSEDFFDVAKFPTLTFASTKVAAAGTNKLKVDGNLTMHGVTKPVTLFVTFLGAGPTMNGEQRSGFEAITTLNRKDFGIVWNKTLDQGGTMLGDDVDIHLSVEGVIRPDQPAPPPKS
jgi:polyisoprenoid-binding protein YceI